RGRRGRRRVRGVTRAARSIAISTVVDSISAAVQIRPRAVPRRTSPARTPPRRAESGGSRLVAVRVLGELRRPAAGLVAELNRRFPRFAARAVAGHHHDGGKGPPLGGGSDFRSRGPTAQGFPGPFPTAAVLGK